MENLFPFNSQRKVIFASKIEAKCNPEFCEILKTYRTRVPTHPTVSNPDG